jgi:hypothetical protein
MRGREPSHGDAYPALDERGGLRGELLIHERGSNDVERVNLRDVDARGLPRRHRARSHVVAVVLLRGTEGSPKEYEDR